MPATLARAIARLRAGGRRRVALLTGTGVAAAIALVLLVVGTVTSPAQPVLPVLPVQPVLPMPPLLAAGPPPSDHPVVVLGASISAGTGSSPEQAWPAVVGRCLGRRVLVGAVPGAGFVATGRGGRGPVVRLLREADLPRLDPSVVVLQAGHNDIGVSPRTLDAAVTTAVTSVGRQLPRTRLVLITVFAHVGVPSVQARATDSVIVAAARRADPRVVVLDPLVEGWSFPRVGDGLHPTAVGQQMLAGHVLTDLARAGVTGPQACPPGAAAPLTPS